MKNTLFGLEIETALDMPEDKIRLHPKVLYHILSEVEHVGINLCLVYGSLLGGCLPDDWTKKEKEEQ